MRKYAIAVAAVALLGGLLAYATYQMRSGRYDPRRIPSPLIGTALPAFRLPALDDPARAVSERSLRGRPYLLNVFASWCVSCREEAPLLDALATQAGVPIVGLDYEDKRADARAWLLREGNPYRTVMVDRDGRLAMDLGVYGVPETFLIDRGGVIRYKQIGPIDAATWRTQLAPRLQALEGEGGAS